MKKNIFLYYLITACQSAWFTEAVWFFYFRQFADYASMGIVFAILNIFWIAFELPTGVLADKLGRKFSTIAGTFFVTVGLAFTGLATGFWIWVVGLLIQNLGRSFVSGSLEALIYDDLKSNGEEKRYSQIAANKSRIVIAVYAIAVFTGGFLGHIDLRLPYLIFTLVSLVSTVAAFYLFEPPFSKDNKKSSIQITLQGLRQFKSPSLKPYLLPAWLLLFIYFIFDWGMTKPAMGVKFGFFEREQGVIYTIISIVIVVALRYLPEIRKNMSNLNGLYLLNIVVLAAFSLALFPLGLLGFIPIMLIETVGSFSDPWISTIMNQHIDSRYRATTLSALQMVGRLPYLLINPIVGYLVDRNQTNTVFLLLIIIIICVLGISRFLSTRHQSLGTVN